MDKINRIKELVDVLHKASIACYSDSNPVIFEKQYDALKTELEARGAKVSSSASSKTGYLINNNINSVSSKNKKQFS